MIRSVPTASALWAAVLALCTLAAPPSAIAQNAVTHATLAAETDRDERPALDPTTIAERARAATVEIRAMSALGDTLTTGSGFLVSGDGRLVTNFHVIQPAHVLEIEGPGGTVYGDVNLLGVDPEHDLAVLQIPGRHSAVLSLGADVEARIGERVYVMGSPLGLTGTFSDGLVSARRPVEEVPMLQITAPISPGSSGGPVMNRHGEVIAVATLIVNGGQNLNLAVPSRFVRSLLAGAVEARPFAPDRLPPSPAEGLASLAEDPSDEAAEAGTNEWVRQVREQLADWALRLGERGGELQDPVRTGLLRQREFLSGPLELVAGREYTIVAVCDEDCTDLSLHLSDADGAEVAANAEPGARPSVSVVPGRGGTYRLGVKMNACRVEPCVYGVAVFGR